MKVLLIVILFPLSLGSIFSQTVYRAVESGGQKVEIDSTTPLPDLIKKLEQPWDFVETGKAYWIGYTDDMYSIAHYKDVAIKPLIALINNSNSSKAKIGAIYTLHLIGIQSKIAGRFIEKFTDCKARIALLSLMNNKELNSTILMLLKRDPWISDIPYFMDYLSKPGGDYIKVLSALGRYTFDEKPFGQKLPENISKQRIKVYSKEPYSRKPVPDFIALQKALREKVVIDQEILDSKEWHAGIESLKSNNIQVEEQLVSTLLEFQSNSTFSYSEYVDNKFFYIYQNDKIYIYGSKKAREIWLNWWKLLPNDQKEKITAANKVYTP